MQIKKQITSLAQLICKQDKEKLWTLIAENHFEKVIELLIKRGVHDEDMGETLYAIAQQAVNEQRSEKARAILLLLTNVLEDKNELPTILSFIADTYVSEGEHEKARQYYGQLPITFENILKIFKTFIPSRNLDGLLRDRDEIMGKLKEPAHINHVHKMVNSLFMGIANDPAIKKKMVEQYTTNLKLLKKTNPSIIKQLSKHNPARDTENHVNNHLKYLSVSGKTYILIENMWRGIHPKPIKERLQRTDFRQGKNIVIRCSSFEQLLEFRDALATDQPEFYKYQCYLITDLKLLKSFMALESLSPLANCDFIIRILSDNNLDKQFHDMLIAKENHVPEYLMHVTQEDIVFRDQNIIPALRKCTNKIHANIKTYEKQITKLFPDGYHNTTIQKIKHDQKLNIYFQTSRYTTYLQYSIRDLAEGFKKNGCDVLIEIEKEGGAVGIRGDICRKNLIDFKPDIIFNINHLRHEYSWIPKSIPYITWVQDIMPNIFELSDPTLIGDNDYIYALPTEAVHGRLIKHPIFKNSKVEPLSIVLNPDIYFKFDTTYKYDVSHVSHCNMPLEYYDVYSDIPNSKLSDKQLMFRHFINYTDKFSIPDLSEVWNNLYKNNKFRKEFSKNFLKIHNSCKLRIDDQTSSFFVMDLMVKVIKSRILKIIIENNFDIHLFGNGWDLHPWFKEYANGPIKNGTELNQLQNESRINLNLNIGMLSHPKFFEVTGGGNFCLSLDFGNNNYLSEMTFHDNSLVAWFNEKNLVEKLRYFLENPEERKQMAHLLQTEVLNKFSSEKTAERILKEFSDNGNNIVS